MAVQIYKYLLIVLMFLISIIQSQLIRSNDVYKGIILDIYNHHKFESITLFYDNCNDDVITMQSLRDLQYYFNYLYIKTSIISIDEFVRQITKLQKIFESRKSFVVILQDTNKIITMLKNPSVDISMPTWLIFFNDHTLAEIFFQSIHIPFNCNFFISKRNLLNLREEIITDIYRIDRELELRSDYLVKWSLENRFELPLSTLPYERRDNLYGHSVIVAFATNPPYSVVYKNEDNQVMQGGYYGEIMESLQTTLNFTCQFDDILNTGMNVNGSWAGGFGALINKSADIFAIQLAITYDRLEIADFLISTSIMDYRLYIKKTGIIPSWNSYLVPFKTEIWLTIGCIIFLTSGVITIIRLSGRKIDIYNAASNVEIEEKKFATMIFSIFACLCGQAMKESSLNPIRVIQFTIHATALLILTSYSALLTSSLAVYVYEPPFTTLGGLLNDGTYQLGVLHPSHTYTFFETSSNEIHKKIFEEFIKGKSHPLSFPDGLQRVCSDDKYAFISPDIYEPMINSANCTLVKLERVDALSSAMAVQKKSPFRDVLSKHIFILKENGILAQIQNRIISSAYKLSPQLPDPTVGIYNILPLIAVLIFSLIISLFLLALEMYSQRYDRKFKANCKNG